MSLIANAVFTIDSWNESPHSDLGDGRTITRATVEKSYSGDMVGTGVVEYLMAYVAEGEATFVGVEHFSGTVGGRDGSVLIRHTGTFLGGVVSSRWRILDRSGRGELAGITGVVEFESGHAAEYPVMLTYALG